MVRRQSIGCILRQKDDSSHAERAIYYLSKKFTEGESNYPEIEKMCCALVWVMQRLQQYTLYHTVRLLSKTDPLKYLLSSPSSMRNIATWRCQLTEYDIEYVSHTSVKGQAITDHLAEFPIVDDTPINSDFPGEGILQMNDEEETPGWKMYFDANFFLSGETLYRRSFDATLLRCVDENEAQRLMEEVHEGNCGPHMNGLMLAKKLIHCHLCQVYADQIRAPPHELHPMAAPWLFSMWGMDVIGPINPKASNGHLFILVVIDYFTKWSEAITLASVTAKTVARFLKRDIIALLPIEVEIPSMRVLAESKLKEAEWAKQRYEQLNLIDERRLIALCHD
ncbi:hypothetical protein CRG98_020529 [Punica granatum]|uniref:Reverse transcriptase RNase H-like domain-containing protein n=1 Tax=Punica granatum TaxID=22663 RepID=A0A2I0JRZ9_PUNGR|nr:hypothetical protein CRG98_020529 [Punica granatum]